MGRNGDSSTVVSVQNLTKVYGQNVRALDGVSFEVERGSVVGLLGPNGAGKTTCLKSMLGLIEPTQGSIRIAGIDAIADRRTAYSHVGAMLESARNVYWRLTVRENLEFFASLAGNDPSAMREHHDRLLDQFGLSEKADEQVNALSRGMKGKVSLACTLSRDVDVAVLDEPTLGLDVKTALNLRRELRRFADCNDTTLLISSHDMDVIEAICDRVVVLNDGRVVADAPVAELVDHFRTRSFRITVESNVDEPLRRELRSCGITGEGNVAGRTTFVLESGEGRELYVILGRLLDADHDILSVETVEPDFEEIFIELTDDDAATPEVSG
jgi:ABC-2 type transport system ATP-binding protein